MLSFYRSLSLRYKLPIAFGLTIIATALIISSVLSWYTYRQMRDDLSANAESISKTLAKGIAPLMLRDDVWQAFESIMAPLATATERPGQRLVIVLDRDQRIFVSSQPRTFPMQRRLLELDVGFRPVLARLRPDRVITWYEETGPMAGHIFVAAPILAEDGMPLGTIIVRLADSLFLDRFHAARTQLLLAVCATIVILLPVGWIFSKRLADPLVALRRRMASLPGSHEERSPSADDHLTDEIADLSRQFEDMKAELARNELLKRQIAAGDRLAALGRLAAGIAHEINNPLGGMINAINTFERFGDDKILAGKTISLLKRGLSQIQETVGAMLVEARLESRAFTPEDIDDLKTLVSGDTAARSVQLNWTITLPGPVALPATPLRQLILNLLLNAIAATGAQGVVACTIDCRDGLLTIGVRNTGSVIRPDRLLTLFEPYEVEHGGHGNGLGLWVCYQIVQQLKGSISVNSEDGVTEFVVEVPAQETAMMEAN